MDSNFQPMPDAERTAGSLHRDCSAAASKPAKPYYTGSWSKSCDHCAHAEPHYCLLYSRTMKNMDVKRCREWTERQNAADEPRRNAGTERQPQGCAHDGTKTI